MMTELMNERWQDWKEKIEFVYARILQAENEIRDIDVAFVEGAIATERQERRLKEIRKNSKHLVAIGSCACSGMPAGQRNEFDKSKMKEIKVVLDRFKHREHVVPLKDLVKVDDSVPGCPMLEDKFLAVLDKYLKEVQ